MGLVRRAWSAFTHASLGMLCGIGVRPWLLGGALPPTHETLRVPDCPGAIEVRVDRYGVPHIEAADAAALFFAQGYCHARDRLWQMDLNRRAARGELAEIIGKKAVPLDRINRRLGFRLLAQREEATLTGEVQTALTAYVAGVNAWISRHDAPVEYLLLRQKPRPWTITDTLAFARCMAWNMGTGWEHKLIRAGLRAHNAGGDAGLAPGGGGSNAWAVAPERSATGHALLANDPHLRPRLPGTWYVAHLRGGGYNVIGATMPGLVGVLVGHNERVAWGVTVSGTDCQDLFLEKRHPDQPHRFAHGANWSDAEVIEESFTVHDRPPVVDHVVRTRHGPLLNGILDVPADGAPISLRCTTDDGPSATQALLDLNRATDWPTFRQALKSWQTPALNFVVADVTGAIAWKLAGAVPVRASGDGAYPVPGDTAAHDWTGTVPFDDLPERVNPPDGVLASANSAPDVSCRYFLSNDFMDDGRKRRILELLSAQPCHALAGCAVMQQDVVSVPAREITARVYRALSLAEHPELAYWRDWDGALTTDSISASLYAVFRRELLQHVHRDLPPDLLKYVLGQGISEPLGYLGSDHHTRASSKFMTLLDELLKPGNRAGLTAVSVSFQATVAWLREHMGSSPEAWRWGKLHRLTLAHPIGKAMPLLDKLLHLSEGPFPIGGDRDTIAQAGSDPWHPFDAACFTVSYRQLLAVGDWDAGKFILPGGQSGQPGSPHYADMCKAFRQGDYCPLLFSAPAVRAATTATIRIVPRGGTGGQ